MMGKSSWHLNGSQVGAHGYECVDGLDASLGMLGQVIQSTAKFSLAMCSDGWLIQARKQTIYQDYIVAMVDGLGSIPINDSTYDVVMSRYLVPLSCQYLARTHALPPLPAMGSPLGRSILLPSLRFWGWWGLVVISSGQCVRDTSRKARGLQSL